MHEETKRFLQSVNEPEEISIPEARERLRKFLPTIHEIMRQSRRLVQDLQQSELVEDDRRLLSTYPQMHQQLAAIERMGDEIDDRFRRMIQAFRTVGSLLNGIPTENANGETVHTPGLRSQAESAGYDEAWPER